MTHPIRLGLLVCAILVSAPGPARAELGAADADAVVRLHDVERCAVAPSAASMPAMAWDPLLASVAQSYANGCSFAHNPDRSAQYAALGGSGYVGENLAWGTAWAYSAEDLAQLWADEKSLWSFGAVTSSNVHDVGHYTQMIWATTTSVGCATALCSGSRFLVCNYAPGGNYTGQAPYAVGSGQTEACAAAVPEPPGALAALGAGAALGGLAARRARRRGASAA
jgi:hypothetical protein